VEGFEPQTTTFGPSLQVPEDCGVVGCVSLNTQCTVPLLAHSPENPRLRCPKGCEGRCFPQHTSHWESQKQLNVTQDAALKRNRMGLCCGEMSQAWGGRYKSNPRTRCAVIFSLGENPPVAVHLYAWMPF
jgi:hypothetical protein